MKRIFLKYCFLACLATAISFSSCKDDEKNDAPPESESNQSEQNASFSVSATRVNFSKQGGVYVISTEGIKGTAVAFADQNWVTVKSVGTNKFEIAVSQLSGTDRSAKVTIAADGSSVVINLFQFAEDELALSSESADLDSKGGTLEFSVTSNVDFTVSTSTPWLSLESSDGGKYIYKASPSNMARIRKGVITISTINKSVTFVATQQPGTKVEISANSTAMDIAKYMYPGWNLGNTMEPPSPSLKAEISWQSTKTTQEIIDYVADCGFASVRIPCSWMVHSSKNSEGKYIINSEWLNRVKEIVDYCINAGLFVELNEHWDNGAFEVLGFSQSSSEYKAVTQEWIDNKSAEFYEMWTQIATAFKDYDNHLLFAGLNEPMQEYNLFKNPDRQQTLNPILEHYNQTFVDAVRSTGGNNATRILVVQGTGADLDLALKYLNMPTDKVEGKLMMEAHYYPWPFSTLEQSKAPNSFNDEDTFIELCKQLKAKFCDKGVPVFIGEYGANWTCKAKDQEKHDAAIKLFHKVVNKWAPTYGCLPFVWDINKALSEGTSVMTIIDREKRAIYSQPAYEGIVEGVSEAVWPY